GRGGRAVVRGGGGGGGDGRCGRHRLSAGADERWEGPAMGKPPPRRSPFRLALPPIAVPLDAIVSPERGTGELIWYELPHAPKFGPRLTLQFSPLPLPT